MKLKVGESLVKENLVKIINIWNGINVFDIDRFLKRKEMICNV